MKPLTGASRHAHDAEHFTAHAADVISPTFGWGFQTLSRLLYPLKGNILIHGIVKLFLDLFRR